MYLLRRPRTGPVIAAALLPALFLAGCGDDGDGGEAEKPSGDEAVEVVHDAVDTTLALDSLEVDSEFDAEAMGQEFTLGVEGEIDYEELVGDVVFSQEQQSQSGELEIRTDGEAMWVRVDGDGFPTIPDGKSWVEGDTSQLAEADSTKPVDLVGVVIALRAAEDVEVGDSKDFDGTAARQYTTTVTYAETVEAAGEDATDYQEAFNLTGADDAELKIEAWIDDDGVIREYHLDIEAGDKPIDGTYDVQIGDPNGSVDKPDAPPSEDVLTGPQADAMLKQMLASSGS